MSLKLSPSDYEFYIPIAEWIEKHIKEWLFMQRPLFKKLSAPIDSVLNGLDTLFNFIPFPMTALEYSQLIIANLKEWKDSDGLWQVQQGFFGDGITSVEFNDKWIKPINNAINDWNIWRSSKLMAKSVL